jgi:hypothetical protein
MSLQTDKYDYYSCFYDTKEMRDTFPDNYPTSWSKKSIITLNQIICSPEIGLFGARVISVSKDLSSEDKKTLIRKEMKKESTLIIEPDHPYESFKDYSERQKKE